jgi:hypothetical protein
VHTSIFFYLLPVYVLQCVVKLFFFKKVIMKKVLFIAGLLPSIVFTICASLSPDVVATTPGTQPHPLGKENVVANGGAQPAYPSSWLLKDRVDARQRSGHIPPHVGKDFWRPAENPEAQPETPAEPPVPATIWTLKAQPETPATPPIPTEVITWDSILPGAIAKKQAFKPQGGKGKGKKRGQVTLIELGSAPTGTTTPVDSTEQQTRLFCSDDE